MSLKTGSEIHADSSTLYSFSVWVYSSRPTTLRVGLVEIDLAADGTPGKTVRAPSRLIQHPGSGWTMLTLTATTSSTTRYLNPYIDSGTDGGAYTIWVDNLNVSSLVGNTRATGYGVSRYDAARVCELWSRRRTPREAPPPRRR